MTSPYDLVVIGAGSAGLTAARFAARLGVKVALVEKGRIGGDCTWTGCVPSKALLKAAKVAHTARTAADYGLQVGPPAVDMAGVRDYIRQAIDRVYRLETPAELARTGIEVTAGPARFVDDRTLQVADRTLTARNFIVATGARPRLPAVEGLADIPFLTYHQIFDNDRLPARLIVVGAGPVGVEMAQAYQRLGAAVTLIGERLLPRDEPEAAELLGRVFANEGITVIPGRARTARREGQELVIGLDGRGVRGDLLFVAAGRAPNLAGLALANAGVTFSGEGLAVNEALQTNVKHIYGAGDCVKGSPQFTHFAGWQGFYAARNALLPLSSPGFSDHVPWTTFTDPEVAHVGLTEAQARDRYGEAARATCRPNQQIDRAVTENDLAGFIKIVHRADGRLLGATIVAERAGEAITEIVLALQHGLKAGDLAEAIHVYPTYAGPIQEMAADLAGDNMLAGLSGRAIRFLAGGETGIRN